MSQAWCPICCTRHTGDGVCPGELPATGPERHGWRVNVTREDGVEAYAVLVAPTHDRWRARIMTYPNVLWLAPGLGSTLKFVGDSAAAAEALAIEFIRVHCSERGYRIRPETVVARPGRLGSFPGAAAGPAPRKIRFLPVLFGPVQPSERAGTGNLSETGLFIITEQPMPRGQRVALRLETDAEAIGLTGEVVWMRREHEVGRAPGMGVSLVEPPTPYVDYVRALEA